MQWATPGPEHTPKRMPDIMLDRMPERMSEIMLGCQRNVRIFARNYVRIDVR
jgi:hypothetical protein